MLRSIIDRSVYDKLLCTLILILEIVYYSVFAGIQELKTFI